ncbi:MAG TPA: 30S ribosomal protein S6 [Thermoleophilaceae bacterium]|nr:30S ribosomal protein S6 [Thermoleophilaceae bacterium]
MAGLYDLMLLIDPNAPEDRRDAVVSEAESMISSGGTLVGSHDWGQRRMAFEIDHRPEAEYRLYQFEGDNALLDRLGRRLRILDGVLRFRIIKAKPGQPVPPAPEHQATRRRDEREPQDTKVAARAAADAPAVGDLPVNGAGAVVPPAPDAAAAASASAPDAPPALPPDAPPAPSADAPSAPPAAPPADAPSAPDAPSVPSSDAPDAPDAPPAESPPADTPPSDAGPAEGRTGDA